MLLLVLTFFVTIAPKRISATKLLIVLFVLLVIQILEKGCFLINNNNNTIVIKLKLIYFNFINLSILENKHYSSLSWSFLYSINLLLLLFRGFVREVPQTINSKSIQLCGLNPTESMNFNKIAPFLQKKKKKNRLAPPFDHSHSFKIFI
jgi:hypothetical protein